MTSADTPSGAGTRGTNTSAAVFESAGLAGACQIERVPPATLSPIRQKTFGEVRTQDEHELSTLTDEALLSYYGEARDAGHPSAERALGILIWRYFPNVHRRCLTKIPRDDAEDVAMNAVLSAIASALDGRSEGEFHSWLNRIVGRRIADYTRKPRPDTTLLPEEHADDEEVWGASGFHPDETGIVGLDELIDQAMDGLSDAHIEVIEIFVFEDQSAEDTVERVNDAFPHLDPEMKIDNVSQIAKRFRERLRELLERAESHPGATDEDEPDDEDPDNPS